MADYVKKPQALMKRGMNISLPSDRLMQEWMQYGQNIRSFIFGEWRQRPGMSLIDNVVASPIYYMNRINDPIAGTFRRVAAAQNGQVYFDNAAHNNYSSVDSGFSGKKYSSVISRPDRSASPYLFLGSDTRNSKFNTTGTRTEWGLVAPLTAPIVYGKGANHSLISYYGGALTATDQGTSGYTASVGSVTGATAGTAVARVWEFDGGGTAPGMASIVLAGTSLGTLKDFFQQGNMFDVINEVPVNVRTYRYTTIIEEVIPPIAATTVTGVNYDSGSSGPGVVTLAAPSEGLRRYSYITIVARGSFFVESVTRDQDGIPSIRATLPSGIVAGDAVNSGSGIMGSPLPTYRMNLQEVPLSPSIPISFTDVRGSEYTWTGITDGLQTATATLTNNLAVGNVSVDGSSTARPIQGDDLFHISVNANFNEVDEIQVQIDCDDGTFSSYYFLALRAPDLFGAYNQSQLAIQAQQQQVTYDQLQQFVDSQFGPEVPSALPKGANLGELNDYNPTGGLQVGSGSGTASVTNTSGLGQQASLFIPVSQFQRVGTAVSDWSGANSIRITVNALTTTEISFRDMYFRGTFGPNNFNLPAYQYAYRARNSLTGAVSNPSPPTRYTINSDRKRVRVTVPSYPDSQADYIDVFRTGGLLTTWQLVASVDPAVGSFDDTLPDSIAIRNPTLAVDRFKPWVSSDVPKSGVCNVVGTTVTRVSGDTFSTSWVRGTQIVINNRVYSLYTKPSSTTRLEISESGGVQTSVEFQIPEPVLDGQTYQAVFGPFAGASAEFVFAVGDPRNPGFLYWTNGNDVESTSDVNYIELCNPSETLMNGCVLDGVVYCFSDKRSWRILPSFAGGQSGAGSDFYPQETAMGKGLATRWGLAVGDAIYFLSYDGIYRSRGDAIESLTDDSIFPIFRREGTILPTVDILIAPVNFNSGNEDEHSLVYSQDGLYFHYLGTDGTKYTLYYSFFTKGWIVDTIATDSMIRSFREINFPNPDNVVVGTNAGNVLLRSSSVFQDNSQNISCRFWDREEVFDDLRTTKQIGDTMIDANPNGATITPTLRYDNNSSNDALTTLTGGVRSQFVRDVNSGNGRIIRSVAADFTWSNGTAGQPKLYAWEPAVLIKPEISINRATDWDNGGYTGTKWVQGFRLRGDTFNVAKDFQVQFDGGTVAQSFTFISNGETVQTFSFTTPFVAHEMRILGTDTDVWRNMGIEWIFEPEPEQALTWYTQTTNLDLPFYSHIREVMIAHRSTSNITMTVFSDSTSNNYTIIHGAGARIRTYLPLLGIKAKYWQFRFTSAAAFGLWINDIEVKAGAWGRGDNYNTIKPFGDISRANGGARV